MTDSSAVAVVRGIYTAMAARDIDAVLAVIGPELVLTQDDRLPWGGRYEGPDGFAAFGLKLVETVDSAVTIDAVFEADDEVVQVGRTKGTVRANGAAFDIAEVHRWVIRDGLATSPSTPRPCWPPSAPSPGLRRPRPPRRPGPGPRPPSRPA